MGLIAFLMTPEGLAVGAWLVCLGAVIIAYAFVATNVFCRAMAASGVESGFYNRDGSRLGIKHIMPLLPYVCLLVPYLNAITVFFVPGVTFALTDREYMPKKLGFWLIALPVAMFILMIVLRCMSRHFVCL